MPRHSHPHSASPDEIGALITWPRRYDLMAPVLAFGRSRAVRSAVADLLELRPGAEVLDVGSGTGTLLRELARQVGPGGRAVGVDPAEEMVRYASTRAIRAGLAVRFEVGAAQTLPYGDGSFDAASMVLVLHHVPAERRDLAVRELLRVVRPGGVVVIGDFRVPRGRLARAFARWRFTHALEHDDLGRAEQVAGEAGAVDVIRTEAPVPYVGLLRFRRALD